ncbi:sugar ABC transporter substrate-binding protein [Ilumatobacter sp.]|uniref:sugar ABC transporter substrate-binding protein n=1 Tax=Ilumatobacter sp. TaxID=1967498 RepID=UPI003AF8A2E1
MRKLRTILVPIAALSLVAAACGGDDDDSSGSDESTSESTADAGGDDGGESTGDDGGDAGGDDGGESTGDDGGDTVDASQGSDLTFHMVTHSDDGPFWSVVKRGMDAAGEDLGVNVVWLGSNNDPGVQVQMIEQAISEGSNGIAASLPSPDQLIGPLQGAVGAGVPVITLNSGVNDYQEIGALTHVGQTEIIAGNGAGERFNAAGATKILCGIQEQSNVALEERCGGLAETFSGEVVAQFMGLDADQTEQQNTIKAALEADPDIDGFLGVGPVIAMSGLRASQDLGRDLTVGGFDITPELIDSIEAGEVAFTVDQQQYLQGYMPILLLYLNVTNANTLGGGLPILTGPGFVTPDNAAEVKALVAAGTR